MNTAVGLVSLVGAGPGDPGLITVRGLRRLREADVVVYDRLVDKRLLEEAKPSAEVIYVGKDPGPGGTQQDNIYPMLIDKARSGKSVVRLKGGDPFVFGRGGEEAQVLAMAGIPFEVVPGITSAIAVPAYAGVPLTHRDIASSFTVVSAQEDPTKRASTIAWDVLAHTGGTLVILMGWNSLGEVVGKLIKEGMAGSTPAAVIEWGTEPYQRSAIGTLDTIIQHSNNEGLGPPSVVIIGAVVNLRQEIQWFDNRPLFGKRILVTRSRHQASTLCQLLVDEGACTLEIPAIEIAPLEDYSDLDKSILNVYSYHWIIFTSVNGVEAFFQRLATLGLDSRALAKVKACAIGSATETCLENYGIKADLVPKQFESKYIVDSLSRIGVQDAKILLPRADIAPQDLADDLANLGANVDQQTAYRTLVPEASKTLVQNALESDKIDIITFTSSSTVHNLLDLINGGTSLIGEKLVACIGPVTANSARRAGLRVDVVASQHTVPGLVKALKSYLGNRSRRR